MNFPVRIVNDMREVKKATEHAERLATTKEPDTIGLRENSFGDHARVHVGNVVSYYLGGYKANVHMVSIKNGNGKLTRIFEQARASLQTCD